MSHAIIVDDLGFAWPEGEQVFDGLSFAIGSGRTGLIGSNGTGKSTLLRLVAGDLRPGGGSVAVNGSLGYLRQDLTQDAGLLVDEVLGVARARRALHAIEHGSVAEEHFTAVGDDWDIEERARAVLDQLGLDHIGLDRRVGEVSGGEAVLIALAAQFLSRPDVLLLDEPTNNLDLDARGRLYGAVTAWPGLMVIVSHDRRLLDLVDQVAELHEGKITWYGGNLTYCEAALAASQQAARQRVRAAESDLHRQQRELAEARIKLDRRLRYGNKMWQNKREPRAVMRQRKRQAQVSAGKHRIMHMDKVERAREHLSAAHDAVRDEAEIRVDLPETAVPAGRRVVSARDARLRCGPRVELEVRGPERIALTGPNGAGKTTLLETIAGIVPAVSGSIRPHVPLRYLPQRLDILHRDDTVAGNVARFAPGLPDNAIRARLARLEFRGDRAGQVASSLSGGERFRAALAALLLAAPPPQLLLLDEPTNNLDMASASQLAQALAGYQGALIVAGHDLPFLRSLGMHRWLRLDGVLAEIDPP